MTRGVIVFPRARSGDSLGGVAFSFASLARKTCVGGIEKRDRFWARLASRRGPMEASEGGFWARLARPFSGAPGAPRL